MYLVFLQIVVFSSICASQLLVELSINTDKYLSITPVSNSFGLEKSEAFFNVVLDIGLNTTNPGLPRNSESIRNF